MKKTHKIGGTNVLLTVLLFLGCLTVLFPLYMTVMIAFKSPTEMTNFSNFSEAMRVTNFWHSLGNSFLITAVTIVLAVLLHSMAGYAIGRNMARKKGYKLIYFYIVSGMFVPYAAGQADRHYGTGQPSGRYHSVPGILYAYERHAVQRLSEKRSAGNGRSCKH